MKPPRVVLVIALTIASVTAPAAQTPGNRADLLRLQAEEAYRSGDHLRALSFLEQAYAAEPQPGILANRGLILERLGDSRRALADFEAYLATNPPPEKRATAETAVRRLRPEVLIGSERPGLELFLDDQAAPAGTTPLRLRLPVGAHLLRFAGPGVVPGQMAFIVEPGRDLALQVAAVGQVAGTPGAAPSGDADERARTWSYVSLGTGVAAAAGGGALTLLMQSRSDERDQADTRSDWKALDTSAERYQTAAGVAFGLSAAAIATGLYFWFAGD